MAEDHIRYDLLAQAALRGVLRTVLIDAAKRGLPGEHHFFITFATRAEGVQISPRLLAEYPDEMTIVMQHQFWDLTVTDDRFQVGLSFGGIPERLTIPFAAVNAFADPSVQFGLQFQKADTEAAQKAAPAKPAPTRTAEGKRGKPSHIAAVPTAANPPPPPPSEPEEPPPPQNGGGADVVRLDKFRKK